MYADYYAIIQQPISLKEITKKVNTGRYQSPADFKADVYLMLNNAMTYVRIIPSPSQSPADQF